MAGAGVIFIALMAFRTLGGQYSGRDREGIVAALIYWYVTVAVYAVIWYTIFVTK
jgi:heme/copper-type cytochrome/quinol oxidase subunit 3